MRATALAILLFISNVAWANDSGGYLGLSLGASDEPARCQEDLTRRCEGNLVGLRGFVGYALSRSLAIEGGVDAVAATSDATGVAADFSGLASMPLGERAALFGRLGVVTNGNFSDLTYGAGLRFDLEEKASLRLEWLHYGASGGADFLFLGILSRF